MLVLILETVLGIQHIYVNISPPFLCRCIFFDIEVNIVRSLVAPTGDPLTFIDILSIIASSPPSLVLTFL